MNPKKKVLLVMTSIIAIIVTIILCFTVFPWCALAVGSFLVPNPPAPKITYSEFPFELICEIDGEEVYFKDTLAIDYKGIDGNVFTGKDYTWDTSFLNSSIDFYRGKNEIFLKKGTTKDGYSYRISFYLGSETYYMGLEEPYYSVYEQNDVYPCDFIFRYTNDDLSNASIENDANKGFHWNSIDEQTLYEEYNIKIIKKSISEPLNDNARWLGKIIWDAFN